MMNSKRVLSLLLCILTLSSALTSCAEDTGTTETTAAETTAAETTTAETSPYVDDELPELDYNGAEVNTFGWSGSSTVEFYVEEQDGDIVNDAIYERNTSVEERLNIKLTYRIEPGANAQRAEWVSKVQASILAGDGANDLTAGYSMCGASLAYNKLMIDLLSLDYIDFEKPWWPPTLIEEAICDGKLYFASGDISTNMIYYLYATYFNKQLVENYGVESPYELVRNNEWTIDKMIELSSELYTDINGDGNKDAADSFGYMTHQTYSDSLFFAAGLRVTEIGSDGLPTFTEEFKGEKTQALLEKLVGFFAQNGAWLSRDYTEANNMFLESRTVFYTTEVLFAANNLRDSEIEYGIVPTPKGSESQEDFATVMSFPYTLYGVPIDAKDPDMSAAVMEALASESYRTVSPALFETALKVKYSSDDDASEMYDLIRASAVFDFGRIFNDSMNSQTYSLFRSSLSNGDINWISKYESNAANLDAKLASVIEALVG